MIAISDNDLRQLLLYFLATKDKINGAMDSLSLANRIRLALLTYKKLSKREDIRKLIIKNK